MEIPFRIFKIENDPIELHADVYEKSKDVEFGFEVSFNGNLKDGIIGCRTRYEYKQGECVLSCLTVYCYFMISKSYLESQKNEGKVIIDKEFLRYVSTISVGTARGILHAKTQGTVLNPMVIPPINLMEMDILDFTLE